MLSDQLQDFFSGRRVKVIFIFLIIVCAYLVWTLAKIGHAEPLTDQDRAEMIDSVSGIFVDRYVYPEVGMQMDSMLNSNLVNGVYDNYNSLPDFTQSISDDLREFSNDLHIWVKPIPKNRYYVVEGEEITQEQIFLKSLENFGWKKLDWLPGGVGYIKVDKFEDISYAGETAEAALSFMANSQAIIIDLRDHHGGHENMQQLVASYFFDEPTQLSSLYWTYLDSLEEAWTCTDIRGPSLAQKDLYILISNKTASGAEAFAYNMKHQGNATIVGENSAGAAHWSDWYEFPKLGLVAHVPVARPINPVTQKSWEGTGVIPDILIPAQNAFNKAYLEAVLNLEKKFTDKKIKRFLNWLVPSVEARLNPAHLDDDLASKYVGSYLYSDGERHCTISYENGILIYNSSSGKKYNLIPMTENLFKQEEEHEEYGEIRIKFILDESGNVTEFHFLDIIGFMDKRTRIIE
jgi:hypothetical protein